MTPQELKNSILQLAIQGKLVEQHPEEGTAEELFRQIQEEKKRLIKEGKIKKEKPLPEIAEDEKPFEIPESWKWARLGFAIVLLSGQDMAPSQYNNIGKGIPYITGASNIENDQVIINRWTEQAKAIAVKGNLLLTCKGTIGKMAVLEEEQAHIARQIMAISNILLDIDYIKFFLESQIVFLKSKAKSMIPGIERNRVLSLPMPLPPLGEQKRIIVKIEELLPYIDRYEQAWNRLEVFNKRFPIDMQKSFLQWAIQGKLVEQRPEEGTAEELYRQIQEEKKRLIKEGKIKKEKPLPEIAKDEVPFEIPESWKWVRLGEITNFQGGYAYKSTSYVPKSYNQIIRLGNVKQGYLFPEAKPAYIPDKIAAETECYRIQVDDILVTMTGTRRKKDYFYVTKICKDDILNNNLFLNQRVGCFRVIDGVMSEYLLRVMQCEAIRELIFKKETGTANQGNLGSEDMKMYVYVPLPPLAEQKRIVAKLEELLPLCERLK